jgi:beta-1,4-N-acetylglucosaminyltransferase
MLLVCSPGGHLQQMLALKPAWEEFDHAWVTLPSVDVEAALAGEQYRLAHAPTNRSIKNLLRNVALAWRMLHSQPPDLILSTGAGLSVPFFLIGKLLGIPLVYVESVTRTEGLSLSGRMVYPLADRFFVQWPESAATARRAEFAGSVL